MTQLFKRFQQHARGAAAGLATATALLASAPLDASAHGNDGHRLYTDEVVSDFETLARTWYNRFDISRSNASEIFDLYSDTHRFYLLYDEKGAQDPRSHMYVLAERLATIYGLKNSREFQQFRDAVADYSLIAGAYQHLAPNGNPLARNNHPHFFATKYKAITDIQQAAADFLEVAAPYFEQNRQRRLDEVFAYTGFCYAVQDQGTRIQQLHNSVSRDSGFIPVPRAMTAEYRSHGLEVRCPG